MNVQLLNTEVHFSCPNCTSSLNLPSVPAKPVLHPCRGLFGLMVPMVRDGTRCKIEAVERGDYVAGELVQLDGRERPVMSVVTTRDEGQDTTVYAPCATFNRKDYL